MPQRARRAGSVGLSISEDLTPLTFKLLCDLQHQQSMDKAWTLAISTMFTQVMLTGKSTK